jgi:hypothetical protein
MPISKWRTHPVEQGAPVARSAFQVSAAGSFRREFPLQTKDVYLAA